MSDSVSNRRPLRSRRDGRHRGVDEVFGRPVLVVVGIPGAVVVVDRDRILAPELGRLGRTFETTCSNANSGVWTPTTTKPSFWYALVPGLDVGQGALAVDARVGPEVDQDDLAAQRPIVSGLSPGVFSHAVILVKSGAGPQSTRRRPRGAHLASAEVPLPVTPFSSRRTLAEPSKCFGARSCSRGGPLQAREAR